MDMRSRLLYFVFVYLLFWCANTEFNSLSDSVSSNLIATLEAINESGFPIELVGREINVWILRSDLDAYLFSNRCFGCFEISNWIQFLLSEAFSTSPVILLMAWFRLYSITTVCHVCVFRAFIKLTTLKQISCQIDNS